MFILLLVRYTGWMWSVTEVSVVLLASICGVKLSRNGDILYIGLGPRGPSKESVEALRSPERAPFIPPSPVLGPTCHLFSCWFLDRRIFLPWK
jgi:hypothetical protein